MVGLNIKKYDFGANILNVLKISGNHIIRSTDP